MPTSTEIVQIEEPRTVRYKASPNSRMASKSLWLIKTHKFLMLSTSEMLKEDQLIDKDLCNIEVIVATSLVTLLNKESSVLTNQEKE